MFALTIVATLGAAGLFYYNDTQARLATYAAQQAQLETSLTIQRETTEQLIANITLMTKTVEDLNTEFAESRERVKDLENTFNRTKSGKQRDFGNLAVKRPGLVEKIVNTATQDVFRCLELLSGATVQQKDMENAKVNNCFETTSADTAE